METENITYVALLSVGLLVVPILIINRRLNISVNKRMLYAIARMVVQLSLVGVFLQYIFDLNNPLVNILYIAFMIGVASFSAIQSCQVPATTFLTPLFLSFLVPNAVVILYFNTFVIELDNIFDAQYLITIGGMLLGNTLSGIIICIDRFYTAIQKDRNAYFFALSLSGNRMEALGPYFKKAVLDAVNPTIASIETIGLVALPGMMTGQILGGAIPMTAIKYQIAIMAGILVTRYFGAILAIVLTVRKAFDAYDVLHEWR